MEELFNNCWTVLVVLCVVLVLVQAFINKDAIKFLVPKAAIPATLLNALFFWVALMVFNHDQNFLSILIPFIVGVVLSLFIQFFSPKVEIIMASVSFLVMLIFYKLVTTDLFIILGVFLISVVSSLSLRLLRSEKFTSNIMAALSVIIPIYAGLLWNDVAPKSEDINYRAYTMFAIIGLGLVYAFSSYFFNTKHKIMTRLAGLIILLLLTYLALNNILGTTSQNVVYLAMGSFVVLQIIEFLNLNNKTDLNHSAFELTVGLGLILITGFIITRVFGIWGLIIVSATCVAFSSSNAYENRLFNWPSLIIFFFSIKAFVLIFLEKTSLNITGLNLAHPYVYIGLVLGLIIPFVILGIAIAYEKKFVAQNFLIMITFGLAAPLLLTYMLHSEAAGAMLLGLSVSSLLIVLPGKLLGQKMAHKITTTTCNALLPLSVLSCLMMIFNQSLIDIGEVASKTERAEAFVAVVLVLMILYGVTLITSDSTPEDFYGENV